MASEQMHIVHLEPSSSASLENFLQICANCHARADSENWPEKVLRDYKRNPWSQRVPTSDSGETSRAELELKLDSEHWDANEKERVLAALSAFLDIPSSQVRVVLTKGGSHDH